MCGILGLIGPSLDHRLASKMLQRLRHRGPDGEGLWSGDQVTLGSARLKIIDLTDNAAQPMLDPQSGRVLVFNGEIYNYRELKEELRGGYNFRTQSDTEVVLAAFARWDEACLAHLRGMFAFALWDPARGSVFMARDRFGMKPLYYRSRPGGFSFASEIKSLVNLEGRDARCNERTIAAFLCSRLQDTGSETMFADIYQLLPAEQVWINKSGEVGEKSTYWSLPRVGRGVFDEAAASRVRDRIIESVALHMRADVEVGCLVSGGLDSSSIACSMAQITDGRPLHTFSSVLAVRNRENALIPTVEKAVNAIPHELLLDGEGFLESVRSVIYHHDEPIADGSMYAHFELMRLARAANVRVVLSGNGGDELFGGYSAHLYSYLGSLLRRGELTDLARAVGDASEQTGETSAALTARAVQEALPRWLRERHKTVQFRKRARYLLHPDVSSDVPFYFSRRDDPVDANFENSFLHWTIPPFLHYEDRNGMAFGVEVRTPFIDHVIVEGCAQYFSSAIFGGLTKAALRRSMVGIVPAEILMQKRKFAFAAPLGTFLEKNMKQVMDLYPDLVRSTPFLDQEVCLDLGRNYAKAPTPESEVFFWRIFSLGLWHQRFFVDMEDGPR